MIIDYRSSARRIYLVVGVSLVLLTTIFVALGFQPLTDRLHDEHARQITFYLKSHGWLIESALKHHREQARQAASRTAIRKKQILYNKGEITLDALITFSKAKLADALSSGEITAIVRFDPRGRLLYQVGEAIDPAHYPSNWTDIDKVTLLKRVVNEQGNSRLIYYSPIIDRKADIVGYDLLAFDDAGIRSHIDRPYANQGNLVLIAGGQIIYQPPRYINPMMAAMITAYAQDHQQGHPMTMENRQGYIVRELPLPDSNWELYLFVNETLFFAQQDRQIIMLLVLVFALAAATLGGMIMILRPLINAAIEERVLLDKSYLKLKHSEAHYRSIFSAVQDMILVLNPDQTIYEINPAATKILGYTQQELKQLSAKDIIHPDHLSVIGSIYAAVEREEPFHFETTFIRKDRSSFFANIKGTEFSLVDKLHVLLIIADISKRRELEKAREQLIATVNHELRTPLTSIAGFTELLRANRLTDDDRHQYLNIIDKESKHLQTLIERLLDLRHAQQGELTYHFESLDAALWLRECATLILDGAGCENYELDLAVNLPLVRADSERLHQVLVHLLSNAMKFSTPGAPIQVSARPAIGTEGDAVVEVKVTDAGIGIPAEAVAELFTPFYQVDNSATREHGGAGLGLALVKEIIGAHQGRVWVESTPDKGSSFYFTLPVAGNEMTGLGSTGPPAHAEGVEE